MTAPSTPAGGGAGLAEQLDALIALFKPNADQADPQWLHWMGAGDSGPDYCDPCCEIVVAEARASGEYPEAVVDGGWEPERESDGPTYCDRCGALLGYALTSYGLAEEIRHWRDDVDPVTPASPQMAYEVYAVLDAAAQIGTEQDKAAAAAIGARLAPLLPAHLTPTQGPASAAKEGADDAAPGQGSRGDG